MTMPSFARGDGRRDSMLYLKRALLLVLGFLIAHSTAIAADYQYLFNQTFSGTPPASSNHLWMDAVFRDLTTGTVQLTVSNLNLTGTENVDELYLNLNPAFDPTKLNFTFVSSGSGF